MLEQRVSCGGKRRETTDTENPRIYIEEWKCAGCQDWVGDEEAVWAKPDGTLSTTHADACPYCVNCVPDMPEEKPGGGKRLTFGTTVILNDVDGIEREVLWADFVRDNADAPGVLDEIAEDLEKYGEYRGGGGASPVFSLHF